MATLLPNGKQQFFDANGAPLAGGTVTFYIPNTTTFKNTWQDPTQTTLNSNPVVLDAGGWAVIYGSGVYRQVVKDVFGNTIWDQLTGTAVSSSIAVISFKTVQALLSDTTMGYSGAVVIVQAGDVVNAGIYQYVVAAASATDSNVSTAGGVKLYVQAIDGAVSVAQYGATGIGTETAIIQAALGHPTAVVILANDRQYTCDEVVVPAGQTFRCNLKMATPATPTTERNLVRVNPGCTLIGTLVGTNQTTAMVVERGVFPSVDGCNDVTLDVNVSLFTVGVQAFFSDLNNPPLRWSGRIVAHDIACFDGGDNGYGLNGTLCQSQLVLFCTNVPRHSVYLVAGASDNDITLHDRGSRAVPVNISSYSTQPPCENNRILAFITNHQANYPATLNSAAGLIAGNCDGNYVELYLSNSENTDYAAYIRGAITGATPSRNRLDVTVVGTVKQNTVIEVASGFNNVVALRGKVGSTVVGSSLVTVDTRDGIVPVGIQTAATIEEIDVDCFANIANAVSVLANYGNTDLGQGVIDPRGITGDAVVVGDVSFWTSVVGWVYENYFHATGTIAAGVSGDITVNFGRAYPIRPIISYALIAPSVIGTNLPTYAIPIVGTTSCTVRVKNNDTSTVTFVVDGTVHGF